jgi:hypothetical protein
MSAGGGSRSVKRPIPAIECTEWLESPSKSPNNQFKKKIHIKACADLMIERTMLVTCAVIKMYKCNRTFATMIHRKLLVCSSQDREIQVLNSGLASVLLLILLLKRVCRPLIAPPMPRLVLPILANTLCLVKHFF